MMKYQKAVEKAKKERARDLHASQAPAGAQDVLAVEVRPPVPDAEVPTIREAAPAPLGPAPGPPAGGGWTPPVYRDARSAACDPQVAAKHRCVCLRPDAPEQDYYKVLRTQISQRMNPKGWNMLMVTSVCPGEGKSLTAVNLALVFAKFHDRTVLLVDCDLRRQSVCRYLGLPRDRGIADYLIDGRELKELIMWPRIEKMTLISGGRVTQDGAELLGSPRMRDLMAELKGRYADRFIIVDAPPILGGADTMVLAQYVDGIVVVVESGKTPLKQIQGAMELVPKEKFLGFVLNKHAEAGAVRYAYRAER